MKAEFRRVRWQIHPTSVPKSLSAELCHLAALSVQEANAQPKQSWLFPPCCLPSPPHNLTKEAVVNGLETPRHTSVYATRGFLCISEGTCCSQNVEGSPTNTQGIFLRRSCNGHIETGRCTHTQTQRGLCHGRFT